MDGLSSFLSALIGIVTSTALIDVLWATLLGIVVGMMPGLTATLGVALMTTLTFQMEAERAILAQSHGSTDVDALSPVLHADDILVLQADCNKVRVEDSLIDYLQRLAAASRTSELLALGVSPRGALALRRAGQARALLHGRDYATPDDFKRLAVPVFAHRVQLKENFAHGGSARQAAERVIESLLSDVAVPR